MSNVEVAVEVVPGPDVEITIQAGAVGPRGPQGIPGEDGPQGPPGNDGVDGIDGARGPEGPPGPPGKDGLDGQPGAPGDPGRDGVDGEKGDPGDPGPPGPPGEDGVDGAQGPPGRDGIDGAPGRDGIDGIDGAKGDQGDQGIPGEKGDSVLYQQPDEPDLAFPPDPSFLWLDTDEEPPAIADGSKIGNLVTEAHAAFTDAGGVTWGLGGLVSPGVVNGDGSAMFAAAGGAASNLALRRQDFGGNPFSEGETITLRAHITNNTGNELAVRALWYNDANTLIASPYGNKIPPGQSGVSEITTQCPAGATLLQPYPAYAVGLVAAGQTFTIREFSVWKGAGGNWAMPGVPITGLGRRVTHPNSDDVLVEVWDEGKGRWQAVHYDSGWRDVTSMLINGWTIASPGRVLMRRIGSMVRLTTDTGGAHYLDASAATNNNFLTLPDTTWVPAQSNPGIAFFNQQMAGLYRNSNPYRLAVQNATTIGEKRWVVSVDWPVLTDSIPTSLPGTLVTAAPN